MADTSGEADIRSLDIDKLLKGFADLEPNVLKQYVTNAKTKAREVRWYQKTSGFLDTPTTDDTAISLIDNVAEGALPFVTEQSFTRNTSYVEKFMVESPMFSIEDLKDNDVDLFATNIRDLGRAVQRKVGLRIFQILTDALAATPTQPLTNGAVTVQNTASVDGWDQVATANPILDLLNGQQLMRAQGYDPIGSILGLNSIEHKFLISYLINVKGSSIPSFSSAQLKKGVVMEILNHNVVVDEIFTTDWVYQWVPNRALTWKQFSPMSSATIDFPLIGRKYRIAEWGVALLTDPKAVHIVSDTIG